MRSRAARAGAPPGAGAGARRASAGERGRLSSGAAGGPGLNRPAPLPHPGGSTYTNRSPHLVTVAVRRRRAVLDPLTPPPRAPERPDESATLAWSWRPHRPPLDNSRSGPHTPHCPATPKGGLAQWLSQISMSPAACRTHLWSD